MAGIANLWGVAVKGRRTAARVTALIVSLVACSVAGCGQSAPLFRPAPKPVILSLDELARSSPEWNPVAQLDSASRAVLAPVTPVQAPALPPISPVRTVAASTSEETADITQAQLAGARRTQEALSAAAQRAVGRVRVRLQRDQNRLLAVARQQAQDRVNAGVENARLEATNQYLNSLPRLLSPNAAQRMNLNVQVQALAVDAKPTNPPTAPDDHWGKLLDARRAALAHLPQPQLIAERAAQEQIAAAVQTARLALQQEADAQIAAYSAALDERTRQALARQHAAVRREQRDLLAVSDELGQELNQPLVSSPAVGSSTSVTVLNSVRGGSTPAAIATAPATTADRLNAQRQRLTAQAFEVTRLRAARAASELNFKVVDWNSKNFDPAAMRAISARMRKDYFGNT